ncbi:MAG: DNA sulfur modification protein DndD [Gomphosphaeria aponina SAG 52.96 = DSM 107014]|uniref:Nuclease SbcCD subunit C n=1 Tax=Gomphosphaeria aponina SAG 52.96 = DSM 107014 TaxID=1521640 RepID=A0A941GWG0_9CHRO|nr:DNA sulfur modification protein DndD [Gomphosphaeria aponina SAG 52.96 = DSM 107014]
MLFTELVLQNFGPYYGKQIINLRPEKDENHRPIILIGGMNGGGKTTLMDAIRLALYGQRAQCSTRGNLGYSEFLSQCVNKQCVNNPTLEEDKTRIELAFEHLVDEKWKEIRIVRTWERNPRDGKDNLGIIDGEWPDSGWASTWDEYIENLLPIGISNLFLFDGEQVKELAEQDTPPPTVIEAIKSLLGLELAERLAVDLDVLMSRKRKAIADNSQLANLEEIEAKIKEQIDKKAFETEIFNSLETQVKKLQEEYDMADHKFSSEGGKIAAERSSLDSQKKRLEESREKQRLELCELAGLVLPLALISPLLYEAQIQGKLELEYKQSKIAQAILQSRDERLLNFLVNLSLSSTQLDEIKVFLDGENKAFQLDGEINSYLDIEADDLQKLDNLLEAHLPVQIDVLKKQLKKLKELEGEINAREKQLAVAASPEEYEKLNNAVKDVQKRLIDSKAEWEVARRRCEEIDKAIASTKKELERYSVSALERQNNEHITNAIAKVKTTLAIFREQLTLKKLNKLEIEVTECFRYLLHKSDLVHRVAIATSDFRLSLYDPEGKPVPKHRLSAGEKQLLAVSFLWGLARVSGRNLPVAIDTPLGRLDSSHRNNLVERYFPTASVQVILLSTDTEIAEKEIAQLRSLEAIAREYLLKYDSTSRQTTITPGYFW